MNALERFDQCIWRLIHELDGRPDPRGILKTLLDEVVAVALRRPSALKKYAEQGEGEPFEQWRLSNLQGFATMARRLAAANQGAVEKLAREASEAYPAARASL